MIVYENLNKEEAIIFSKFLVDVRNRHNEDIRKIDNIIRYLESKHDIEIEMQWIV